MKRKNIVIKDIKEKFNQIVDKDINPKDKGMSDEITKIKGAPGQDSYATKGQSPVSHLQGMTRLDNENGVDDNFILTGSVRNSAGKNNPGYFYLVKNKEGFPPIQEKKPQYISIDKVYTHPSGIQVCENILAIGNEKYKNAEQSTEKNKSIILFYDINDFSDIKPLTNLKIKRSDEMDYPKTGRIASAVGLTQYYQQWILAVREVDHLDFYSHKGLDLLNAQPKVWDNDIGRLEIDDHLKKAQCIQLFLSEENGEVNIYLLAMAEDNDDKITLYKILFNKGDYGGNPCVDAFTELECINTKWFVRKDSGPRMKYCSCVYYDNVADKFIIYSGGSNVRSDKIKIQIWNE